MVVAGEYQTAAMDEFKKMERHFAWTQLKRQTLIESISKKLQFRGVKSFSLALFSCHGAHGKIAKYMGGIFVLFASLCVVVS